MVTELIGAELDRAVAKVEGLLYEMIAGDVMALPVAPQPGDKWWPAPWSPSTDWSQGGPIIERERIDIQFEDNICWATRPGWVARKGPTPLIAAMRAFVASKA